MIFTEYFDGIGEEPELYAFLFGVMYLLAPCGHLVARPAVDDRHLLRAQSERRARRVHRHVARAYDYYVMRALYGSGGIFIHRFHEVYAGKEFVGGAYSVQPFAFYIHEHRQPRARAEEYIIVVLFKVVESESLTDDDVGLYAHSEFFKCVYLRLDYRFREPEFGYSVNEHAAGLVEGFEYGDVESRFGEIGAAAQSRRSAADHRRAVTVTDGSFCGRAASYRVIAYEPFERADGYGTVLLEDAVVFALRFLRAHATADRG